MDTPYQWTKQVASHFGGTRNGTIVHWPKGLQARAKCAANSTTSSTSAATILDVTGHPRAYLRQRDPADAAARGVDGYSFDDARRARSVARPSISRCSATGAFTTRVGRRSPGIASRGLSVPSSPPSMTTSGSCMTPIPTGPRPTTSRPSTRQAERTPASLADRGGQVQRAAPRRSTHRAVQLRYGRPARAWSRARPNCSTRR